ncbi:NAD-dependent epimerase/dehydratase family protein [Streptomyces hoynatensis]|uniref:NAD-dependent epimerase/dehydratase family protein n=2 Tax=Streptomyces hoynatensis TaxID=1141874 RepID=A0A3A9Z435_9ACTN|nr:NAD-dependent epimerase/dehydratase family protein [Streptomyces hoynatensis]
MESDPKRAEPVAGPREAADRAADAPADRPGARRGARLTVAVAGGTGTLGREVAGELRRHGHEVRVLSRRSAEYRVDLATGEGLADALAGCDVVVDAANNPSSAKGARLTLVEGTRHLLAAGAPAGVRHHVCVSLLGCERVPVGYNRVKEEQERLVTEGPLPWSIVRAAQFHELVGRMFTTAGRRRVLPVPGALLQPVAAAEVAAVVAEVAEGPEARGRVTVAGPEVVNARALARTWRSLTGRRALLLPVRVPGRAGRALRAGALTDERPDYRGSATFADWVMSQRDASAR